MSERAEERKGGKEEEGVIASKRAYEGKVPGKITMSACRYVSNARVGTLE